ncbi:hypothetical protein Thermo_00748 [Thermoplasmatales archaeon]|nr:hypothetical protein Thermo_00748 [Thermoplasmatales archaeon]
MSLMPMREFTLAKKELTVKKLFSSEDKMNSLVGIPAGAVQTKWAHWDLNPDLRVSSRFIVPVTHHKIS